MTVQWGCGHHFSVSNGEFLSVRLFQLKRRPSNKPLDKYERRLSPPQFCVDRFSRQVSYRLNWAVAYCRVSSNSLQGSFEIENRRFFYHSECFILKKKCCSFARSDSFTCCFSQKKMSKRWGRWPGFLKIFIDCQFVFWKLAVIVLLDNSISNKMSLSHNFPFQSRPLQKPKFRHKMSSFTSGLQNEMMPKHTPLRLSKHLPL